MMFLRVTRKLAGRCPIRFPLPICRKRTRAFIEQFSSGSEESFAAVYARFHDPILRFVRRRIADDATAEEITQEVFLKIHRFQDSYDKTHSFSTWLWTIARNTLWDHLRTRKAGVASEGDSSSEVDELPSDEHCAETLLLKKDQRRSLVAMARSLTRLQRRVLWLRIVHQLTFQEIAKRLNLSLSAVKNLSYRAKLVMKQEFGLHPSFA